MSINAYQKRDVLLTEVVRRINLGDVNQVPRIILSVSPCRSGTTIFLRVFGSMGIQAHYQEIKNVLRWQMQNDNFGWKIPQAPGETVYLKETLGPYTEIEAKFNPLDILLKLGFPPEKLQLVIIGRAPLDTWASWDSWWREVTAVEHFISAYETTEQIRLQAQEHGLPVTTFVYEVLRDCGSEKAVQTLFKRLGIPYTSLAVAGWRGLPAFGASDSNVILPEEPPAFFVPDLHTLVEQANELSYYSRGGDFSSLEPHKLEKIQRSTVPAIYKKWRAACEQDLGLKIKNSKEILE